MRTLPTAVARSFRLKCTEDVGQKQWCIAKNGGGYTQKSVAKGLKAPCLFMIAEFSLVEAG